MRQPRTRLRNGPGVARGFTLIEVLVTLAIVAILCALAWPGYGAILQRAQRNEARLALLTLQHEQERHYQVHFSYAATVATPRDEGGLGMAPRSPSGAYILAISLRDAGQGYIATATIDPAGSQSRDRRCAVFSIDETGLRRVRNSHGADSTDACWK